MNYKKLVTKERFTYFKKIVSEVIMWDLLFEYSKENPPPKKPRNRFYKGLMTPAYREYLKLYADWERVAFEAILPKKRVKNVMDLIRETGSEEGFEPTISPEPTRFRPGSKEKVNELRRRVERGENIWASEDSDYADGIGESRSKECQNQQAKEVF